MMSLRKLKNRQLGILMLLLIGICTNCSYEFPEPVVRTPGTLNSANLERTVFLGGTWFSGVHNGALTARFAPYNVPDIFLNTLAQNSIPEWQSYSAIVDSENGFNIYENVALTENIGQYVLEYPNFDTTDFDRVSSLGQALLYDNVGASIQNFSFPEGHLVSYTLPDQNRFYQSFNSSGNSPLQSALASNPTFFVLNAGFEDILRYAQNGAEGDAEVSLAADMSVGDLPSLALFQQKLDEVVDAFLDSDSQVKGALINIPNVLNFPHFTEVYYDITPYVLGKPILTEMNITAANYNGLVDFYYARNPPANFADRRPTVRWPGDLVYNWGILLEDPSLDEVFDLSGNLVKPVRHATREDRIVMSVEQGLDSNQGNKPENALKPNQYLNAEEIQFLNERVAAYNQMIEDKVASSQGRLTLVDSDAFFDLMFNGINLFLDQVGDGFLIDGVPFSPIIGPYGVFSADGVNMNPRGNALVTNIIIDALNQAFDGNLPRANPNDFAGTPITARE